MIRRFAVIIMPLLLLAACAPTTATRGASFVDPAYQGKIFTALAVEAEAPVQEREIIERNAVAKLQSAGITAQPSLSLFPPTRDYSQQTKRQMLGKTGLQGLLVITPSGKRMIEDYIPPSRPYYGGYGYHGRGHRGFGTGFGYDFYDPGMILREPQADYIASIYTLPKFDRAWTGDFTIRGSNGMDFNDVAARFGAELIQRLGRDGVVVLPVK